ncbi:MAG: hypothetical protein DRG69_07925 [Deltaproteobacteria bacterium]|nr:MAG: hypothetical protein DRG69_07925 [Deltaproteobacteria bacterium]
MKKVLVVTLSLLLLSTALWAAPRGPQERRRELEMLRMWKLTEELDLSEEEAAKVFPLLRRYSRKRQQLQRQRWRLLQELRGLLDEEAPPERLKEKMRQIEAKTRELEELRWKEWQELKKTLSTEKQARYLLFHERFARDLWKILRRGPKGAKGGP